MFVTTCFDAHDVSIFFHCCVVCSHHMLTLFIIPHYLPTATFASTAMSNLANTTVQFATSGCPMRSAHTTAPTVAFAALVAERTSATVKIAVCALTNSYSRTTIVRWANICPTVQYVRRICSVAEMQVTNCPVGMPYTGIALGSWQVMTVGVPCVKRQPRRTNE